MAVTDDAMAAPFSPDWSTLPENLPCPRCGYNLRMLTHSRCPECGVDFNWDAVIAAATRQIDSPLFEHCWRTKPLRSLAATTWRLLRPVRFWRNVPLEWPPRLPAICLQTAVTLLLASVAISAGSLAVHPVAQAMRRVRAIPPLRFSSITVNLALEALTQFLEYTLSYHVLPAITGLLLLVFWQTRRRCRVRTDVLLRVVAYAWAITMPYVLLAFILEFASFICFYSNIRLPGVLSQLGNLTLLPIIVFFAALTVGLHLHVRLRRAWSIVLLVIFMEAATYLFIFGASVEYFDSVNNPVTLFLYRATGYSLIPLW